MITTSEVEKLVKDLASKYPYSPEERRKFLPTQEQTKVLISFLKSSELCEGIKSTVRTDQIIPKRAICISEKFKKIYPEVEEWSKEHPEDFMNIYSRIVWR